MKKLLPLLLLIPLPLQGAAAFVQIAQTSCTNCSSVTFGSNLTVGGAGHLGAFSLLEINISNQASSFSPTTGSNWVKDTVDCGNDGGIFHCKSVYVSCNLTAGSLNATFTQATPPDGFMILTFYEASGITGNTLNGCIDTSQRIQHNSTGACGCTGGCASTMFTCNNAIPSGDWVVAFGFGVNIPSQVGAPTLNASWTGHLPAGGGGGVTGYTQVVGSGSGGNFRGDTNVADFSNPTSQNLQTIWTYGNNTGGWATEMVAFGGAAAQQGALKKRFWITP